MEIVLKRDSWHYKLQKYMFGPVYFQSFCPYFWLTIFCLIASPFVFGAVGIKYGAIGFWRGLKWTFWTVLLPFAWLWRHFVKGCDYALERTLDWIDSGICLPLEKFLLRFADGDTLEQLYRRSRDYYLETGSAKNEEEAKRRVTGYAYSSKQAETFKKMDAKFQLWKENEGFEWKRSLQEILARRREEKELQVKREREAEIAREIAKKKMEARRRQLQVSIAKWTKVVTPYLLTILGSSIVYGLYRLGVLLVSLNWSWVGRVLHTLAIAASDVVAWLHRLYSGVLGLNWTKFVHYAGLIASYGLLVIVGLGLLIGVIVLMVKLWKKCNLSVPVSRLAPPLVWTGTKIWFVMRLVASPFRAFGVFVIEYIKIAKKDYCPNIKWEG